MQQQLDLGRSLWSPSRWELRQVTTLPTVRFSSFLREWKHMWKKKIVIAKQQNESRKLTVPVTKVQHLCSAWEEWPTESSVYAAPWSWHANYFETIENFSTRSYFGHILETSSCRECSSSSVKTRGTCFLDQGNLIWYCWTQMVEKQSCFQVPKIHHENILHQWSYMHVQNSHELSYQFLFTEANCAFFGWDDVSNLLRKLNFLFISILLLLYTSSLHTPRLSRCLVHDALCSAKLPITADCSILPR